MVIVVIDRVRVMLFWFGRHCSLAVSENGERGVQGSGYANSSLSFADAASDCDRSDRAASVLAEACMCL